jgi:hypothetical protein
MSQDWSEYFGVTRDDQARYAALQEDAKKRTEGGGGVSRVVQESVEPVLNLASQAVGSKLQAAQIAARDDAREVRPKRRRVVVEESQTEFIDDGPEFD